MSTVTSGLLKIISSSTGLTVYSHRMVLLWLTSSTDGPALVLVRSGEHCQYPLRCTKLICVSFWFGVGMAVLRVGSSGMAE